MLTGHGVISSMNPGLLARRSSGAEWRRTAAHNAGVCANAWSISSGDPYRFSSTRRKDSGKASAVPGVTEAQVDQVRSDIKSLYGYDPLGVPDSIPYSDTKKQLKFDYQITDKHRLTISLENTESGSVNETGDSTSTSAGPTRRAT